VKTTILGGGETGDKRKMRDQISKVKRDQRSCPKGETKRRNKRGEVWVGRRETRTSPGGYRDGSILKLLPTGGAGTTAGTERKPGEKRKKGGGGMETERGKPH